MPDTLRHPDRLAGTQDVQRRGRAQVERLVGLAAGGAGRDVEGREAPADGERGIGDSEVGCGESLGAQAGVDPAATQGVGEGSRQRGAAQAAEITAEAGRVELEGGVLAVLRGGEAQVELGAAAELLPGPGLEGGEVARLARQLAAHQRAAQRHLDVARPAASPARSASGR